jgi:hypothetical protein
MLTNPTLRASTAATLTLHALLAQASVPQWQRSRVIADDAPDAEIVIAEAVEAGSIRSKRIADPTFDAATDPTRLALRAAVIQAEDVLARHHAEAREVATVLDAALTRWNGGL